MNYENQFWSLKEILFQKMDSQWITNRWFQAKILLITKNLAAELKTLDLSYLKAHESERKAFFINLYNVQMIHALAIQETLPEKPLSVQGM